MPIPLCVESLEVRALPAASFQTLPVLPFSDLATLDHARAMFALGKQLGCQADVVLKIGDSNSSPFFTPNFLAPLGDLAYNPVTSGLYSNHASLLGAWSAFVPAPIRLHMKDQQPGPAGPPIMFSWCWLAIFTPPIPP